MMDLKSLGRTIQTLREEKNMSQEQLAGAIGCSQATISNYEKGKRRIYFSHIKKLSEVLGAPASAFLNMDGEAAAPATPTPASGKILDVIQKLYFLDSKDLGELDSYIDFLIWRNGKAGSDDEY